MIGRLLSFARRTIDGAPVADAKIDPGGENARTVQHFAPAGDDSHPLPGDTVLAVEAGGSGEAQAVGYIDPVNPGEAGPGEKRLYARDADGNVVAQVWLKNDGELVVESTEGGAQVRVAPDGTVHLADETGAAKMARADRVDAEIARIWNVLTTWVVSPNDGGAALKTAAGTASADVQSTAADKVRGT